MTWPGPLDVHPHVQVPALRRPRSCLPAFSQALSSFCPMPNTGPSVLAFHYVGSTPDCIRGPAVQKGGGFQDPAAQVLCKPSRWRPAREPGCVALGPTPNKLPPDLLSASWLPLSLQADLNTNMEDGGSSFYGVSSQHESPENMIITCSTKVCSFGKQVVEKVEVGAPCTC